MMAHGHATRTNLSVGTGLALLNPLFLRAIL
jgi:hypothetical protein